MSRDDTPLPAFVAGRDMSAEVYRLLLEYASDAIFSVHLPSATIRSSNPRLEEMTGYAARELVGAPLSLLCPTAETTSAGRSFGPDVLQLPGLHEDIRFACADGRGLYGALTVGHLPLQGETLAICILRDTTERQLLERELITKHMALRQAYQELTEMTQVLERRNQELSFLSKRMASVSKQAAIGAFTAGIAHSINNPLAVVVYCCREMGNLTRQPQPDVARLGLLVQRASDAATRIQHAVLDLRDVQRGGSLREARSEVQIQIEVDRALQLYQNRMAGVTLTRDYATVSSIMAYPDELQYLLTNLIDNALIALEGRGSLCISVSDTGSALRVAVDDDGPGVPDSVREQLFEPFVTTRPDGTGIGLSMARRLAQHHGGRLYLEPKSGPGARFVLELPKVPAGAI